MYSGGICGKIAVQCKDCLFRPQRRSGHFYNGEAACLDNLSNIGTVKELCRKYGFTFSKTLGQNFLVNPSVCPRIAEYGNARPGFGIIEIGAGFGVLTVELAKRAERVVVIEIDEKLLPVLDETLAGYDNIKVIHADVLEVDLHKLIREEFAGMEVAVCANLPYYVTSPILMHLLESRLPVASVTVMVQKEAAQRLCAQMGTRQCGSVTAAVRYYSEPSLLFHVSRGSFMPAPNVDSSVIRLDIRKEPPAHVENEAYLFRVIRSAFSQRRKTLPNSLSGALSLTKEQVAAALTVCGLSPTARAEELTLSQFISLANTLYEVRHG